MCTLPSLNQGRLAKGERGPQEVCRRGRKRGESTPQVVLVTKNRISQRETAPEFLLSTADNVFQGALAVVRLARRQGVRHVRRHDEKGGENDGQKGGIALVYKGTGALNFFSILYSRERQATAGQSKGRLKKATKDRLCPSTSVRATTAARRELHMKYLG